MSLQAAEDKSKWQGLSYEYGELEMRSKAAYNDSPICSLEYKLQYWFWNSLSSS